MQVFHGNIAHSTDDNPLEILSDTLIGVKDKKIEFLLHGATVAEAADRYDFDTDVVQTLHPCQFIIPGFIDSHIHAPQFPNSGLGLDLPLLKWLNKYTFPLEAKFEDSDYAKDVYSRVVKRILSSGTTTASYFATIHLEASLHLVDIVESLGQRAYIGKVNMNRNSPSYYVEGTESSITDTTTPPIYLLQNPLVTPIITPRYPPSTCSLLLRSLAEIVKEYDLPIQSHLCETKPECKWLKDLYPEHQHFADIFKYHGLLHNKTVLAHGIYLTDEDLDILRDAGAGISHCPNSNLSICSGCLDARHVIEKKVKLGLGTDVSGGYSPSMLNAQRQAVMTSSVKALEKGEGYRRLDYKDAFKLATLGSAEVLGLDKVIGNFEVGKEFDALLINPRVHNSPFDVFSDDVDENIQKFLHLGDDRNIREVYVAGRKVSK